MGQAVAEPELINIAEAERAALREVEQLVEHAGSSSPVPLKLVGPDGSAVALPAAIAHLITAAVRRLAQGQSVRLVAVDKELTTQQAAELLNISRPYLVKLLEQGEIPYTMTGTHRRIRFPDLMQYRARRDRQRAHVLTELTQLSQELGLYDEETVSDRIARQTRPHGSREK